MHPILFRFGPLTLYTYGVMLVVAFLVSTWLAIRAARRLPPALVAITDEQLLDFSSLTLLGGIAGARLFYILLQWELFVSAPQELLAIWHGGLVWYGGLAGGLLAGWLYIHFASRNVSGGINKIARPPLAFARGPQRGIPKPRAEGGAGYFMRVMDQCIPFGVLGHAIGRLGCFLNGCCYGKPTESWCGVVFPGQPTAVLPTQLFEAFGLLTLFLILRKLQRPSLLRHPGRLFGVYLVSYAVLRFGLEFLRGDQTIWWAGLTLQQLISVGILVAGIGLVLKRHVGR